MAYSATPAAPRTRPTTVTAAVYLLYALVVSQAVSIILAASVYPSMKKAFEQGFRDSPPSTDTTTDPAAVAGVAAAILVGALVVFHVFVAVVALVLAILDGKGKNPARITTWVVLGISLCCFGAGASSGGSSTSFNFNSGSNTPNPDAMKHAMDANIGSWFGTGTTVLSVLDLLLALGVIVLLLLPASNVFFRKGAPAPAWEPPVPGAPTYPVPPPAGPPPPTGAPYPPPAGAPYAPPAGEPPAAPPVEPPPAEPKPPQP